MSGGARPRAATSRAQRLADEDTAFEAALDRMLAERPRPGDWRWWFREHATSALDELHQWITFHLIRNITRVRETEKLGFGGPNLDNGKYALLNILNASCGLFEAISEEKPGSTDLLQSKLHHSITEVRTAARRDQRCADEFHAAVADEQATELEDSFLRRWAVVVCDILRLWQEAVENPADGVAYLLAALHGIAFDAPPRVENVELP